jgi:hypothetical protein
MHRLTAIAVILSILAASAGELVHACTMADMPRPAASAAPAMPCHGAEGQSGRHSMHAAAEPGMEAMDSMDCCDDAGVATCFDCLCTAVSMPLSALETAMPDSAPVSLRHAPALSTVPPPERPPEYLLRPPISVS